MLRLAEPAVLFPQTTVIAAAKVNLVLHVVGRRDDGYHLLSSLVAFAETGDGLSVELADRDRLEITGPFASALAETRASDNLVMRALKLARDIAREAGLDIGPLAISLDKQLPVASGIGGGSADAAAMIAVLMKQWPELADRLRQTSIALGADVPMCVDGVPTVATGVGERLSPLGRFAPVPCVLINSGIPVSTPEVFRRLVSRDNAPLPPLPADGFGRASDLFDYLTTTRNDLEAPAASIAPEIRQARIAHMDCGARFARMSGSGATVFGLYDSDDAAREAGGRLSRLHPTWWVHTTRLAEAAPLRSV